MIKPNEDSELARAGKRKKKGWNFFLYGLVLVALSIALISAGAFDDQNRAESATKLTIFWMCIISANASVALMISGIVLIILGNTGEKRLRRQKNVRVLHEMKERRLGFGDTGETQLKQQENVGVLGNPAHAQMQTRNCKHCKNDFEPNDPNQVYCSKTCKRAAQRRRAKR